MDNFIKTMDKYKSLTDKSELDQEFDTIQKLFQQFDKTVEIKNITFSEPIESRGIIKTAPDSTVTVEDYSIETNELFIFRNDIDYHLTIREKFTTLIENINLPTQEYMTQIHDIRKILIQKQEIVYERYEYAIRNPEKLVVDPKNLSVSISAINNPERGVDTQNIVSIFRNNLVPQTSINLESELKLFFDNTTLELYNKTEILKRFKAEYPMSSDATLSVAPTNNIYNFLTGKYSIETPEYDKITDEFNYIIFNVISRGQKEIKIKLFTNTDDSELIIYKLIELMKKIKPDSKLNDIIVNLKNLLKYLEKLIQLQLVNLGLPPETEYNNISEQKVKGLIKKKTNIKIYGISIKTVQKLFTEEYNKQIESEPSGIKMKYVEITVKYAIEQIILFVKNLYKIVSDIITTLDNNKQKQIANTNAEIKKIVIGWKNKSNNYNEKVNESIDYLIIKNSENEKLDNKNNKIKCQRYILGLFYSSFMCRVIEGDFINNSLDDMTSLEQQLTTNAADMVKKYIGPYCTTDDNIQYIPEIGIHDVSDIYIKINKDYQQKILQTINQIIM